MCIGLVVVDILFSKTNQPINQSTNQPINQSTNQPINQSTNQPINQSTNQPTTDELFTQYANVWNGFEAIKAKKICY